MSQDRNDRPRRRSRTGLVAMVVAVLVLIVPMASWASHRFSDVPDSNVFHEDISWLAESGVTLGCNPPENTLYCPSDYVTREQMSAFLRRLANNRVVDAASATNADHADHATTADEAEHASSAITATNSDTVDGRHADELGAYVTGLSRDALTGSNPIPLPQNTPKRLLQTELNGANGGYAEISYAVAVGKQGANNATLVTWVQLDDNNCQFPPAGSYLSGSGSGQGLAPNVEGASVSWSLVTPVEETSRIVVCGVSVGANLIVSVASLTAVQSDRGTATIATSGSGSTPADELGFFESVE